jgi:Flp pilus assembly protein TadG
MRKFFISLRREEHGVALPEFALILPILAALLFGMLDFGRAVNYWTDATHLTHEGARMAAVGKWPGSDGGTSLASYLRNQADTDELENGSTSVVTPLSVCVNVGANVGDPIVVRATFTYRWLAVLNLDSTETTITSSATMRREVLPATAPNYGPSCT